MRNKFIFGTVWTAIIVGIMSFGFTVFFLGDKEVPEISSSIFSEMETKEISYKTNQTAIRTNDMASVDNLNYKNETENKSVKNEKIVQNSDIKQTTSAIQENIIKNDMTKNDLEKNQDNEEIEVISKDIMSFVRPVKGEVLRPLSIDELIYSKTLNEWNVHQGTDYKAKIGEEVVAVESGKIKEIGKNDKYGEFIIINHSNGYESLCANLTVLDALTVGKSVKKGQLVGYVAESYGFEVAEETHIHLELKKDGKYISI